MDKVVMNEQDLVLLLHWRDENKDLVRQLPCPLKAVEIVLTHNGFRIKGIRTGNRLKLYLNMNARPMGSTEFRMTENRMWASVPGKNRMQVDQENLQAVLTVYCSLMALMTYASPVRKTNETTKVVATHKPTKGKSSRKQNRTTYILRKENGTLLALPRGSHSSPAGIFTVRGHFRHYKSGKVVWIAEYQKGTGKKHKKTYKIGGNANG